MTVREMVVFLEVAAGANTATGRTDRAGLTAYAKVNVRLSDKGVLGKGLSRSVVTPFGFDIRGVPKMSPTRL